MIKIIWIQISFALHYPNNIIPKFCFTTILSKSCHSCGAWAPVLIIMRFNPSPFSIQLKNGRIWRQCNSPWWLNCWKIKPQTRSHVDIKTYNKNWELRKTDLDWSHGKPFMCSFGVQGYDEFVMERNPGFNWLFPFYTQDSLCMCSKVQYVLFSAPKENRKKNNLIFFFPLYIYK